MSATDARARPARDLFLRHQDGFVRGTWYAAQAPARAAAVLIVTGIGHEERRMNVGVAAAAEALAARGLAALCIDLHGAALGQGRLDDAGAADAWWREIRCAYAHLRDAGYEQVIVIGARLGATLAIEALADERLAALVLWAPIASGRRHLRELRVMQTTDPANRDANAIEIAGFAWPPALVERIATLDLAGLARIEPARLLVVDKADALLAPWLDRPHRLAPAERARALDLDPWLFEPSDEPPTPTRDIETIARWCADVTSVPAEPRRELAGDDDSMTWAHRGRAIRETFFELPPVGLSAVLCEPADDTATTAGAIRLILSTVGPGRTFTDFARDEAARGRASLRFDFAGLGSSARRDGQPTAFYTDPVKDDIVAAVDWLRRRGWRRIYGLGFCAGAWSMLQAGPLPGLVAMVGINLAFYRQPGPRPSEPPLRRWTRRWPRLLHAPLRAARRLNAPIRALRRTLLQPQAGEPMRWLLRFGEANRSVLLAYADRDDGLEFLQRHLDRPAFCRLRPRLRIETYEGLGHLMEGSHARARLFDDIADHFAALDCSCVSAASEGFRESSFNGGHGDFAGSRTGSI